MDRDCINRTHTMRGKAVKAENTESRREIVLRWFFWMLFALGVMSAFAWKTVLASASL